MEEKEWKRRRYEEWRRKDLGDCYAERLDYNIGTMVDVTIGKGILGVLKPGDKVLINIGLDAFVDPCFMTIRDNAVYIDGYIPIADTYCTWCSNFDAYGVVKLYLRMRGVLPLRYDDKMDFIYANGVPLPIWPYGKFVVAEYKGNGVLEVISSDDVKDYDYYLAKFTFGAHSTIAKFNVDSVVGATWHEAYEWTSHRYFVDLYTGEWQYAPGYKCCEQAPLLIVPTLVRRGEEARIRFFVIETKEEEYETVISTHSFPPIVQIRDLYKKRNREKRAGEGET